LVFQSSGKPSRFSKDVFRPILLNRATASSVYLSKSVSKMPWYMKYLSLPTLTSVTNALDGLDNGETNLSCKLECYSCKKAGEDKKFYQTMDKEYREELSKSPKEQTGLSASPFGPMIMKRSRELLIDLITVLNSSFTDYDFSGVRESQFVKEELGNVITQINSRLSSTVPNFGAIRDQLWMAIDKELNLKDCAVYSFTPDVDSNPFEDEGDVVWSFNYFFVEKKQVKRILLFTSHQAMKTDYMDEDGVDEGMYTYNHNEGEFGMEMMMEY